MIDGRVVELDPSDATHVAAASDLILALFAKSPAGQLGPYFLKHFYLRKLPEARLMEGLLYEVDGEYVGFILYTAEPYSFIETGTRKFFPTLAFTVAISLLSKPTRLLAVLNVRGQDHWRRTAERDPELCEMLTFGVLPPFRKRIDRRSGRRISRLIFESALRRMLERGRKRCLLVVAKENALTNRFYHKYGTRPLLEDYSNESQELWVFDLDPTRWTAEPMQEAK